jgi:hypothetical protein
MQGVTHRIAGVRLNKTNVPTIRLRRQHDWCTLHVIRIDIQLRSFAKPYSFLYRICIVLSRYLHILLMLR